MAMEFLVSLGDLVFRDEEKGSVIGGPHDLVHPLEFVRKQLASAQVLDLERVLAITGGVGGVGQKLIVVAGNKRAHAEELVALGKSVEVEQDLFRRIEAALFTAMD